MTVLKIAIIEDDPKIAEIQRRFLDKIDNVELVGIAHSVEDANAIIEVFQPHLVLLDVYLPDGNGLDLLRQWRADNSPLDVILITAAKEVDVLRNALRSGVFEYILKPLVFERLEEAINNYQRHLDRLNNLNSLRQDELDSLISNTDRKPKTTKRLPKGIDALTLDKVREILTLHQDFNAEEVGQQIGASRTTARRYLEFLVGSEEAIAEISYGQVGRPERRYKGAR
ncbi:response regulator [Reinekea marina]|uniref:Transcriptional regulatory protein n=1 Tax=Reinekea marina TaxID=1310421 RepID=A0ABV7WP56_9GAMM|nr:response regulator [Reinekea marina]MDN3648444.1 response regulator [Reinekea marina]